LVTALRMICGTGSAGFSATSRFTSPSASYSAFDLGAIAQ
jgi:hypothetical protein